MLITGEYRPELIPRRGEWLAWGGGLLVAAAWLILYWSGKPVPAAVPFLAVLLSVCGLSISLGNWLDRHTRLHIGEAGLSYTNGLRRVHLTWQEIQELLVRPAPWGHKIDVIGSQAHFTFHTLGEVRLQGEVKGRMGFVQGEQIFNQILNLSGLALASDPPAGMRRYRRLSAEPDSRP